MLLKVITQRNALPSGGISFQVRPPSSLMMLGMGTPNRPIQAEKTHRRSLPSGSVMR